jgi:uncharacterized repeat protein (TIGR03943 family)
MPKSVQPAEGEPVPWETGRLLASLTLLEWGALLVYFYASGRLVSLLHPSFHPLVLVTGVIMSAAGGLLGWREAAASPSETACDGECCEPSRAGFSAGRLVTFLVLSVPIAFAVMVSPDGYGSGMIRNRGLVETVGKGGAFPMPKRDAVASKASPNEGTEPVEVGDLLMAAQSETGMARFDGKRVELIGQVFPLGPKKFELVRMLMLCCAADAQMLAVRVASTDELPAMKWAKVTGRVGFTRRGNNEVPLISAENVTPVQRPADPYVYRGGTLPAAPRANFKVVLPPR